ncbi:peptidase inhibitor family I36 protein [Micromonospora peucetia]|uniref:peptidase inhibitor family I36 protein n=1 Tax=Micromonospora peucetia TaxID=47871 RepID=UPI00332ACFD7
MKLAARMMAALGLAALLGPALVAGGPAGPVSAADRDRPAQATTVGDRTERVRKAYRIEPDGTAREVPSTAGVGPTGSTYAYVIYPAYQSDCLSGEMCIWTGDYYSGWGLFMGGNYASCQGWRFEGTVFQDHTWSIWNRVPGGTSSIWNRYADGSYRYTKYARLATGYKHDTRFSLIMDAWAFEPANNCRRLNLGYVDF